MALKTLGDLSPRGFDGTAEAVAVAGVCVMRSHQWWTATAFGVASTGWMGASAYQAVDDDHLVAKAALRGEDRLRRATPVVSRPQVWWRHQGALDPAALYGEFLNIDDHDAALREVARLPQVRVVDLMGLQHRGLMHLLDRVDGFDREGAVFLARMVNPEPTCLQYWWTSTDVAYLEGPSGPGGSVSGETLWLLWASPDCEAMSGGADVVKSRRLGRRTLRRLHLIA